MARTQTTRGGTSQAAGFAAGRGLLIVLFATAIGVLLLAKAVDSNGDSATAQGSTDQQPSAKTEDGGLDTSTSAQSTVPPTTATTVAPKKEPQNVVVLVANGRGVAGAAKANADALSVENYNVAPATDYPTTEPGTKVYYTPDYQADAIAIAAALTIPNEAVGPLPEGIPLDLKGANVLVVLGTDGLGLSPT